jgi:MEMO1 family protein
MPEYPRLRPLDFQPVFHLGQQMWYLRDPLELTPYQIIVPQGLAPMLMFCDGQHTPLEIHAAFCQQIGEQLPFELVDSALAELDKACLLENENARLARLARLAEYHAQPHRPPTLADLSYPADAEMLTERFEAYGRGDRLDSWAEWRGRGIISPHIDYQRGGPVYAKVWRRAATAVAEADLVLILGTDHNGSAGTITLTRQAYATPYGVLPAAPDLVQKLAEAIGPEAAFAEELHHRQEHSVELSAVWLHHIYTQLGVAPKPMLPILCGSFHHFVQNGAHPEGDEGITAVIHTLQRETKGLKVLAVASVDFAHVGPNFGDRFVMDERRRADLRSADEQLMEAIVRGDAADFYRQIASVQDRNRICGFSPIYLLLRYLDGVSSGHRVAYDHCPADAENHSLVSIGGLLLE